MVRPVALAGELLGLLDDGEHHVDLVHVLDALEQERHPLEAHAGVDVALGQRARDVEVLLGPDRTELVLHEDQVPDLEVAVLELRGHLGAHRLPVGLGTVLRPTVVEDLRAGATRARDAHRPVVLLAAQLDDPVLRQAGHLGPQRERLVVTVQDRGPQPALLQAPAAVRLRLGDQVPGVLDGAFLEVVTEAEVAAHLEEGAVARGLADVLDVGRAHALLHARRPGPRRRLLAQEVGLERHHARVDEQQGRVRHQQRRGGHGLVTGRLEVRDEAAADLGGVHQAFSMPSVVEE